MNKVRDIFIGAVFVCITQPVFAIDFSGDIYNSGNMFDDISILPGYSVKIQNSGEIYGNIYIDTQFTTLNQLIKSNADIKNLKVVSTNGAHFDVLVENAQGNNAVDMSKLVDLAGNFEKITILNSDLNFDMGVSYEFSAPLVFSGENVLNIYNVTESGDFLLLTNVERENGSVNIKTNQLGLNVSELRWDGDSLYINVTRDTDYQKVIGDNLGAKINSARGASPNNKTILALDAARTQQEIDAIMKNSVMFNPINLTDGLEIFNNMQIMSGEMNGSSAGGGLMYIFGGGIKLETINIGSDFQSGNWQFLFGGYIGGLQNSSYFDEYSGLIYGASVLTKYNIGSYYVATGALGTMAKFKTDVILTDDGQTKNPSGFSGLGYADVGADWKMGVMYIAPSTGVGYKKSIVLDESVAGFFQKSKLEFGLKYALEGFEYNHSLFIGNIGNNIMFGGRVNLTSTEDYATVGLVYSGQSNDNTLYHKVGIEFCAEF